LRLLVVADMHGAFRPLADFLRSDDVLISLGDHVNVLDYKDLSGLLSDFIDQETIAGTLSLIQEKKLDQARAAMGKAAGSIPDLFSKIRQAAQEMVFEMVSAFPCQTHLIYGNVDFPDILRSNVGGDVRLHEADVVDINRWRFGLVSGHPPGPYSFGMPGEVSSKVFAQRLHDIGACEVLCVHSPPAIDGMTYDVVADRDEQGSKDSLYYAELHRPRLVLFGHIHQPKVAEYVDREVDTDPVRYLNVGCFRDTGRALQIDSETLETQWVQIT